MNKMNQTQTRSPRKRLLSLILAVILMIGLLPISAFATAAGAQADEDKDATQASEFLRIFHLDCGRKYFSVSEIEGIIDQLAENHFTHLQLAFGNDGLRFLLDDMSVTVNGTDYSSTAVTSAIKQGNKNLTSGSSGELSQDNMDAIIKYANDQGIQIIPLFNAPGHMYTAVNAMDTLGVGGKYIKVSTLTDGRTSNWAVNPTDATAVAFAKALLQKYVIYFAGKGSTMFNIGADESGLSSSNYASYAEMVNDMNDIVKAAGMTTLAYNDGIYRAEFALSQPDVKFDNDIVICYWTEEKSISVAEFLSKGFKILNNNGDWYYVLGDYLYKAWESTQWSYQSALSNLQSIPVTQMMGYTGTEQPMGSILCVWCDGPSVGYTTGYGYREKNQTNQQSVYNLIKAMAENNPDYFKDTTPVLAPVDGGNVSPVKQADGSYNVAVAAKDTVRLNLSNASNVSWSSSDETVATVDDTGLVTFTGKTGTVKITAQIPPATRADEGASYTVTFNVTEKGAPIEVTVAVGRTVKETLQGNQTTISGDYSEYVTVTAEHKTTTAGKKLLEITSAEDLVDGEQYLIVNQRMVKENNSAQLLTGKATTTATGGWSNCLLLSGKPSTDSTALWTITKTDSGYTLKNGSYLNIGNSTASVSSTSEDLTLACQKNDGTVANAKDYPAYYWNISYDGCYLNALGGETGAGGWQYTSNNDADIDIGSRWTIYRIVDEEATDTTTVSFTGVQVGGPVTVTVGDTTYSVTVVEAQNVEIPITIIDYRADGLLFDYSYLNNNTYSDSYRYDLIHGKRSDNNSISVTAEKDDTTGLYTVDGTADITSGSTTYLKGIAGTKIEQTGTPNANYKHNFGIGWGDNSWSRAGLVEETLGINGMPVYTDAAVQYVASLLKAGYYNDVSDSAYNCNSYIYKTFVAADGKRSIRNKSATEFSAQFEVTKSYANISNAYDLAWYLLNTIYQPDTEATVNVTGTDGKQHDIPLYGMAVDTYKSIVLTANGNKYTFEAGYSNNPKNVLYDRENGTISNGEGGISTTSLFPLDRLGYEKPGLLTKTSKIDASHNGSFTLRGESQFVYNEGANLYFTFTGDDDVYMYINGVLALDLGGAHGRNTKTVNLNDLDPEKYGLKEGQVATFTFFYMERCSDASTFGIETNMELVQRDIAVEKNAYSDSQYTSPVNSGAVVDNGRDLFYDLVVTNKGNTVMTNFTFEDTDSFTGKANLGFGVTDASVTAGSGQVSLSANGYTCFVTDADGN